MRAYYFQMLSQIQWLVIFIFPFIIGSSNSLICEVNEFELLVETNEHSSFYLCNPITLDGDTYDIAESQYSLELNESLKKECKNRLDAKQDTFLSIPDGEILSSNASIYVPDQSLVSFISLSGENSRRKLDVEFWNNGARLRVLPIRILTNDGKAPTYKADDLYKYIFADSNSLKWQFHRCSIGKLTIEPTNIGVLNVNIDQPSSSDKRVLVNEATTVAIQKLSISSLLDYADLIMFITPPQDGWVAYGIVGGRSSVYNDKWGASLAVQMHEMGHNFFLQHSNEGAAYEDHTGAMGSAIGGYSDKPGLPLSCYNSYNNWMLGWYNDKTIAVNPSSPQMVTITAFVDYRKTGGNQYVVASVDDQLFMQYNRAKDFNRDTYEYKDDLVIVRKLSGDLGTNLVASLNLNNPKYQTELTIGGSKRNLIVEVCSSGQGNTDRPDWLTVSIGFDRSLCSNSRRLRKLNHNSTSLSSQ